MNGNSYWRGEASTCLGKEMKKLPRFVCIHKECFNASVGKQQKHFDSTFCTLYVSVRGSA